MNVSKVDSPTNNALRVEKNENKMYSNIKDTFAIFLKENVLKSYLLLL